MGIVFLGLHHSANDARGEKESEEGMGGRGARFVRSHKPKARKNVNGQNLAAHPGKSETSKSRGPAGGRGEAQVLIEAAVLRTASTKTVPPKDKARTTIKKSLPQAPSKTSRQRPRGCNASGGKSRGTSLAMTSSIKPQL